MPGQGRRPGRAEGRDVPVKTTSIDPVAPAGRVSFADTERRLGSAMVSGVGIVLFFANWPMFNTLAALAVNAAVLVALVVLRWTPPVA